MQNKPNPNLAPIRRGVNIFATTLVAAGLSLTALSATAHASANDTVKARVNTYQLQRADGVQFVYENLEKQAQNACRSSGPASITERRFAAECTTRLLNDFVQDLDDTSVTSYHNTATAQ